MRKFLYTTALLTFITVLLSSVAASCQKPIYLTVTHIEREDSIAEVYAKRGYEVWMARCVNFPDSIKRGTKLTAQWIKKEDGCKCVFKRIK